MSLDPRNHTYRANPQTPDMDEYPYTRRSLDAPVVVGGNGNIPGQADEEEGDDVNSIYTLEEDNNTESNTLYDLPTHISSHGEVSHLLGESPRTLPPSPVGTPFRERPSHPLRALTATNLVLNQHNGTDESLISSSPLVPSTLRQAAALDQLDTIEGNSDSDDGIPAIIKTQDELQREKDWAERGAASVVKRVQNQNGEEEDIVIRRSVKDFKFGKTLGNGSYSTVILATDKNTQRQFAVKVLDKRHIIREKKVKYVNIEKNTLNRLGKREGIVHLFFTFQDESSLYFVLDYAPNGELLSLIKKHGTLNEETTRYYAAQIIDAIKYMHDNGVIHRDLKPENILLDAEMKLQITDFGTAKLIEKNESGQYPADTRSKSFVGTAEYVSPELLNEQAVGKACDIWAFGCIVYQMIAGKPPFKATNEYLTFQKIVKLQYAFTAGFPMVIRDLIKKILVLNPKDRITIRGIQNHLFFQGIDFRNPKASIWDAPPPVAGPYKISAKSMLPVPELNTGSKTRVTLPRRSASTPNTPTQQQTENFSSESVGSVSGSTPSTPQATRESQQVLARAKANIAARKQKAASGAAGAAALALSRQPNEIMKAYNEKKEAKSAPLEHDSPPVSASTNVERQVSGPSLFEANPQATSAPVTSNRTSAATHPPITTLRKKPPQTTYQQPETLPMTKLDLEFVDYLNDSEERVVKKGEINVYMTTVEAIEKKYKRRLVEAPLGGSKHGSSHSSMLSQVANGSYMGLRNMDKHGEEAEKSIITNHKDTEDLKSETTKAKFKKFFSAASSEEDKKNRVLVATSNGRALIFNKIDAEEGDGYTMELRTEVDLAHPVIKVKELLPSSTSQDTPSLFVIESYSTAFVFESTQKDVTSWTQAIHKARVSSAEKAMQKRLEADPSGDAGTVLGSDAAMSAATIATSPKLKPAEKIVIPKMRVSSSSSLPTNTSSSTPSIKHHQNHMLKDLVQTRKASGPRTSVPKEIPNKGRLYHGLPIALISTKSKEQQIQPQKSKNPLIAAAEAAIVSNASHKKHSPTSRSNSGSLTATSSAPKHITGMNSRLLARSVRSKTKK